MAMVKCSKCGEGIGIFLDGLFRPTYTNVICPACNTKLELTNAGLCYFLNGIIGSGFFALSCLYELYALPCFIHFFFTYMYLV